MAAVHTSAAFFFFLVSCLVDVSCLFPSSMTVHHLDSSHVLPLLLILLSSLSSPASPFILSSLPNHHSLHTVSFPPIPALYICCPPLRLSSPVSHAPCPSPWHFRGNLIWLCLVFPRIPSCCRLSLPPTLRQTEAVQPRAANSADVGLTIWSSDDSGSTSFLCLFPAA